LALGQVFRCDTFLTVKTLFILIEKNGSANQNASKTELITWPRAKNFLGSKGLGRYAGRIPK
jgi:hypothetical protein